MTRAMLLAVCVAAGGDPEPYLLEGSPDATRAIVSGKCQARAVRAG
jgi:hypothetical protein